MSALFAPVTVRSRRGLRPTDVVTALLVLLLAAPFTALVGCRDDAAAPAAPPAPGRTAVVLAPVDVEDPIGALSTHLEARTGWCVQIRSLGERSEAEALIARIEDETSQLATALEADLGDRGTWWRICVGAEPSRLQAARRAAEWTRKGGLLAPYMDKAKRGEARYFIKERTTASDRTPSEAQARLLLAARPDERRRVHLARRGPSETFLGVATTAPDEAGHTEVVLVDDQGVRISFPDAAPPGCTPCLAARKESGVVSRAAWSVGNLLAGPAEAIVVQEETEAGDRYLVVVRASDPVSAVTGLWLGRDRPGLRIVAQAESVEADRDDERELAVVRTELPIVGDHLCALRTSVDIHDVGGERKERLDERYIDRLVTADTASLDVARVVAALTAAFDRLGDSHAGSRVCRAASARAKDPEVTRHCVRRVTALLDRGDPIAAVNAAALLAELDEGLRPAVAPLLFKAAQAVDAHPHLVLEPDDCARRPLVAAFSSRSVDDNLHIAETALAERLDLAEVVDAALVTGARDFGPDTPVGQITGRWLARFKATLPGRHAAIEALLLPNPTPLPTPTATPAPTTSAR